MEPAVAVRFPASAGSNHNGCNVQFLDVHACVWHYPIGSLFEDVVEHDIAEDDGKPKAPVRSFGTVDQQPSYNPLPGSIDGLQGKPERGKISWSSGMGNALPWDDVEQSCRPVPIGGVDVHHREHAVEDRDHGTDAQLRHENGHCKPCFFWYYASCIKGSSCQYCHIKHPKRDYQALRRVQVGRQRVRSRRQQE